MWKDILSGFIRHILTLLAAWLVGRGIIDSAVHDQLVGSYAEITSLVIQAFVVLAPFFLSLAQKVRSRIALKLALGDTGDEVMITRISQEVPLGAALMGKIPVKTGQKADSTPPLRFPG